METQFNFTASNCTLRSGEPYSVMIFLLRQYPYYNFVWFWVISVPQACYFLYAEIFVFLRYIVVWNRKLHGCGWESILRFGWSFDQGLRSRITYLERWLKCHSGSSFGLGCKIVTFTNFYVLYNGFLMYVINLNRNVRRNLCLKGLISDKKDARERPKWSLNAQQVLRK